MRITTVAQPINAELRKVENARKAEKDNRISRIAVDRSDLSSKGKSLNETQGQFSTIEAHLSAQPDVRAEKIAEVKAKIERGYYNSDEFIDKLADKLLNEFGIKNPKA